MKKKDKKVKEESKEYEDSLSELSSTSDEDINYMKNHPFNMKKIPENIEDN